MSTSSPVFTKNNLDALNRPTGQAHGLPPQAYYTQEAFEHERQHAFKHRWLPAAFGASLPEIGSVYPTTYAGWELVFVRGKDERVRCFHNICRHRGTKVVQEAGVVRNMACPWHAWAYGLDGKLLATPNIGGRGVHEVVELEKETHGLLEVRCEQWMDLLFVNIDGEAVPFDEYIAPIELSLKPYDRSKLRHGAFGRRLKAQANWKIVIEAGTEGYHLPVIHPKLNQPKGYEYTVGGSTYCLQAQFMADNYRNSTLGGTREGASGVQFEKFPHLKEAFERNDPMPLKHYYLPPSAMVGVLPDMIGIALYVPVSVNETAILRSYYFNGDSATRPELAERRQKVAEAWDEIGGEDMQVMENAQRMLGLRDELAVGTRFSPYWESGVHNFQKFYVDMFKQ